MNEWTRQIHLSLRLNNWHCKLLHAYVTLVQYCAVVNIIRSNTCRVPPHAHSGFAPNPKDNVSHQRVYCFFGFELFSVRCVTLSWSVILTLRGQNERRRSAHTHTHRLSQLSRLLRDYFTASTCCSCTGCPSDYLLTDWLTVCQNVIQV